MSKSLTPKALAALPDDQFLNAIQRQTFRYFWEGADPSTGLAADRRRGVDTPPDELVTIGGSGFGVMAIIVAAERGWVPRAAAVDRVTRMLEFLAKIRCFHGAFSHFVNVKTGLPIPLFRKDDGGDLVETSLLFMGLLCAREYFGKDTAEEARLRGLVNYLWEDVEWDWYTQEGRKLLYWHWSPNNGWSLDHEIRGWNECLITYVLAAGARRHAIEPDVYHRGFAGGRHFVNGRSYHGIELPLGPPLGGPLFLAHYSFCGLDPRGLTDSYADYWKQNVHHVRINHAHCVANPFKHKGYGADCWGITASDDPDGYLAHAPDNDNGTIAPTAALASMPYAPKEALRAARHFLSRHGRKVWGRYGFYDAFCERRDWFADTFLAIDQGPIIIMIENFRSGLLWNLFMRVPEVRCGLQTLGFRSTRLSKARKP